MDHFVSQFKDALIQISPLSEESMGALVGLVSKKKFKKGELFQAYNEKAVNIGFLVQGAMLVKRNEEDGKEKVIYFNLPEKTPYVGVLESLIQAEISNVQISAVQDDTIICVIEYQKLISLFAKFHELETLGRKLLEKHYLIALKQGRFRQNNKAKEKIEILKQEFPEVNKIFDQKDIASYLGVDPSHYSRLKKNIKNLFHLTNVKSLLK
jgi:CRP-like cAMP-binding protein